LRILEIETHSKPLSKRIENVLLATLSGHLKGGVHDHPIKQTLTRILSVRPHPKLSSKSVSFVTLSGHLGVWVHDWHFKQHLT
jgi:hypothetical protein